MPRNSQHKRVFVAMSGGVDSTVSAALLQHQGFRVEGLTMSLAGFLEGQDPKSCPIEDARRLCDFLGIPHHVVHVDDIARSCVIDYFVREYLGGRTPNPCVQCNTFVKFRALFDQALSLGADCFATGHYAKVVAGETGYSVRKAADLRKDQTYFLYGIDTEVLPRLLFPLGNMTKEDVRAFALEHGLPCAQRPDSQDICFVPEEGYKVFLNRKLGSGYFSPGPFRDSQGKIVGEHQGIGYYTIGQRDQLGIALGYPVYVYRIDVETNTIYVGPRDYLSAVGLIADGFHSLGLDLSREAVDVFVRIRYNAPDVAASVRAMDGRRIEVRFRKPQYAVTPGQSVVFYDGDRLLGGAVIDAPLINESLFQKG